MTNEINLATPIGILGFGVEGQSTARFLLAQGHRDILIFDKIPPKNLPVPLNYAGEENYLSRLPEIRLLFRSAGIRPDLPELVTFQASGAKVTSQIELFMDLIPASQIIGVTGTLGKGTCCSLLQKLLEAHAEKRTIHLGGNIGVAALDLIPAIAPEDLVILELSSFQLSTLNKSPHVAIILKTTSEHLDWHINLAEYWKHKSHLVAAQKPNDHLIFNNDAEGSIYLAKQSPAQKISFGKRGDIVLSNHSLQWPAKSLIVLLAEMHLPGAFNLENAAAALAAALILGIPQHQALKALKDFSGLEHRLEFIRHHQNIDYFNDSYATRPDATIAAVATLNQMYEEKSTPLLNLHFGLILGGSDKHADFADLITALMSTSRLLCIAFIGQTGPKLLSDLQKQHSPSTLKFCDDLPEALRFLQENISAGAILLSPACASFGLFANYKERGKMFKKLIHAL